jgi:hypothetical protein
MAEALGRGGQALKAMMKSRAPSRTGAGREGIDFKVLPRSGTLKVGLLSTKAGRSKLFYMRIQDLGRKGQSVKVRRANTAPYVMRVRAMTGKKFVTGRFGELRATMRQEINGIFSRALQRISGTGSGND